MFDSLQEGVFVVDKIQKEFQIYFANEISKTILNYYLGIKFKENGKACFNDIETHKNSLMKKIFHQYFT